MTKEEQKSYKCEQCGCDLWGFDMLALFTTNQVCKSCVRKNHKKVIKGKK